MIIVASFGAGFIVSGVTDFLLTRRERENRERLIAQLENELERLIERLEP